MTILEMLGGKIIPWVHEQGMHRLMVADDRLEQEALPDGMVVTRKKLRGRRVASKGPRKFGNHSGTAANWPKDGLREDLLPFIVCVLSGRAEVRVGELAIQCSEGHFLLIPPRAPYSSGDRELALKTGNIPDLMAFQTWDDHLQCGLHYSIGTSLYFPNHALVRQLDLLFEEALSRRPDSESITATMFSALLAMMRRDLAESHYFGQSPVSLESSSQPAGEDAILRVQRYVKSNLGQSLTTEAAATMALMSRSQFVKRFREATGQSFNEYVTHCRVEEAKLLLSETDWTISEIHKFIGFRDATRLRQIFTGAVGVGLIEYRNQTRASRKTGPL